MMDTQAFVAAIHLLLEQLLNGEVTGEGFVQRYNDLMADEIPEDLPQEIYAPLDEYHTEFNLYVENPAWRREHPDDYYGPEILLSKARLLLGQVHWDQGPQTRSQ